MSGRDELGAEPLGALDQRRELQIAVAVHARNRRAARRRTRARSSQSTVSANCSLEVDDVVGDADPGGDAPRVVEIVDRAARAEARTLALRPTGRTAASTGR